MNNNLEAIFKNYLKKNDQSVTKVRLVIFKLLVGQEPQTIHELYLKGQHEFDRASLYRTIKLFEDTNIVHRINVGWKYKIELTDKFSQHHHHLICQKCGRVFPIKEDTELEHLIDKISRNNSFKPQSHQLEIQGICQNCQL